jgi:hypothetical protein
MYNTVSNRTRDIKQLHAVPYRVAGNFRCFDALPVRHFPLFTTMLFKALVNSITCIAPAKLAVTVSRP